MDREMIRNRITERLEFRLEDGMIDEVRELLSNNILTLPRLDYFGLEYKYIGYYLANKIFDTEIIDGISFTPGQNRMQLLPSFLLPCRFRQAPRIQTY